MTGLARNHLSKGILLGLLPLLVHVPSIAAAAQCFKVYDATLYVGKPDMRALGIEHITLFEPARWWKGLPADDNTRRATTEAHTAPLLAVQEPVIIDLELPLTGEGDTTQQNIGIYLKVVEWMRAAGFTRPLAFYGSLPIRDYWRAAQGPGRAGFSAWQSDNDRLQSIVPLVDALYPSLYTFYDDQDGWVKYARSNIDEARRLGHGKPVYPFLWPQYHNSNKNLAFQYVDGGFWLRQLRTVRDSADGVVLWGGWDFHNSRAATWDENADWWRATRQFLSETKNLCALPGKPEQQ